MKTEDSENETERDDAIPSDISPPVDASGVPGASMVPPPPPRRGSLPDYPKKKNIPPRPPHGNIRGRRHGLNEKISPEVRIDRYGLTIGAMPKHLAWVARRMMNFRMILEDEVARVHGKVTFTHTNLIELAVQSLGQALKSMRYLRDAEKLSITEKMKLDKVIVDSSVRRNRAIALLGLEEKSKERFDEIYGRGMGDDPDGTTNIQEGCL